MKPIKFTILVAAVAMLGSVATVRTDSAVPKSYPLKKCVVSDEPLGEHGKPIKVTAPVAPMSICAARIA